MPVWAAVGGSAAVALVVVLGAVLLVGLRRERARTARALAQAQDEATVLRRQVEEIEHRLAVRDASSTIRADPEFLITRLGEEGDAPSGGSDAAPAPTLPAPLFADLVLRETAVQAVSLAAGLRRALAPEVRHRIRFEMRREIKRARKQRRVDHRQAVREWQARQRVGAA